MTSTNTDSILAELFSTQEPSYNPSSQPSSPVVESEEFDQTRKRTFSVLDRDTTSSIVADSDDESYDVESSDERPPKRAKNAKKYGGYKRKGDKYVFHQKVSLLFFLPRYS
jgi:hypothetical protein